MLKSENKIYLLIGNVFQWYKNCSATCLMLLTNCSTSNGAPTRLTSNLIGSRSAWNKSPWSSADFKVYKLVGRVHPVVLLCNSSFLLTKNQKYINKILWYFKKIDYFVLCLVLIRFFDDRRVFFLLIRIVLYDRNRIDDVPAPEAYLFGYYLFRLNLVGSFHKRPLHKLLVSFIHFL